MHEMHIFISSHKDDDDEEFDLGSVFGFFAGALISNRFRFAFVIAGRGSGVDFRKTRLLLVDCLSNKISIFP